MKLTIYMQDDLFDELELASREYIESNNYGGSGNGKFNHSYMIQLAVKALCDNSKSVLEHKLKVAEYNTRVAQQRVDKIRERLQVK